MKLSTSTLKKADEISKLSIESWEEINATYTNKNDAKILVVSGYPNGQMDNYNLVYY